MIKGYLYVKQVKGSDFSMASLELVKNIDGSSIELNQNTFKFELGNESVVRPVTKFIKDIATETYFFEVQGFSLRIIRPNELIRMLHPEVENDLTIASIEHDKFAVVFELRDQKSEKLIPEVTNTQANPLKIYKDDFNQYIPLPDISDRFENAMRSLKSVLVERGTNSKTVAFEALLYLTVDFLIQCRTNYDRNMLPDKLIKQVFQFSGNAINRIYGDEGITINYRSKLESLIYDANIYRNFGDFVSKYDLEDCYDHYDIYS